MRKDTLSLCNQAVGGLENAYSDNPDIPALSLSDAVNLCYQEVMEQSTRGSTSAIRFDSAENIKQVLRDLILGSGRIKLK